MLKCRQSDSTSGRYLAETLQRFGGVDRLDGDVLDAHSAGNNFDGFDDCVAAANVAVANGHFAGEMMLSQGQAPHVNITDGSDAFNRQNGFFKGIVRKFRRGGLQKEPRSLFENSPPRHRHKECNEEGGSYIE